MGSGLMPSREDERAERERVQKDPEYAVVCVIRHLWRSASSSIANIMIDTKYTKM